MNEKKNIYFKKYTKETRSALNNGFEHNFLLTFKTQYLYIMHAI